MLSGVYRAVIQSAMFGNTYQNVLHFQERTTISSPSLLAAYLQANWINEMNAWQVDQHVYQKIIVTQIEPTLSSTFQLNISLAGAIGGGGFNVQHGSVCGIFSLRTPNPGRVGRGRFYVSGAAHGNCISNVVSGGLLAIWVTRANNLKAKFCIDGSSNFGLVVKARTPGSTNYLVSDIIPKSTWGIQRRRNQGVGI